MASIEPNWTGLILFSLLWGASCLAFLTLVGMMPLGSRPEAARGAGGAALVICNLGLLLLLALGSVMFAHAQIRWTSAVVAGGLVFLFAPALFQVWPSRWRDSRAGLALLVVLQVSSLALLVVSMPPGRWTFAA